MPTPPDKGAQPRQLRGLGLSGGLSFSDAPPPVPHQALARMAASGLLLLLGLPVGAWPGLGLPRRPCVQCCHAAWPPAAPGPYTPQSAGEPGVPLPRVRPTIDISILKGECLRRGSPTPPVPTGTPCTEGAGKGAREP